MDTAAIDKYLDGRFTVALEFYDNRAGMYKRWYRRLSVYVLIISAALTAFVALVPPDTIWRVASTALSASIVIATGLLTHYKCHENWLSYRATWDALRREREFYDARVHEYASASHPHALFVERVEVILAREATDFYARHLKSDESSNPAQASAKMT
jgi:hypothetical protein